MADTIKCLCGQCGAKYRLPVEFQGRTAKCKKCGAKFEIPRVKNLEDSVLDWLADEEQVHEESLQPPRVVNMPKSESQAEGTAPARKGGVIRMRQPAPTPEK